MKVLLAVDESRFSEAAIRAVAEQMKPSATEVCVLHAYQPLVFLPEFTSQTIVDQMKVTEEQRRAKAQALVDQARESLEKAGFRVVTALEDADPRNAIIERAEAWKADLIVVGSHGRKGLDRFLMGSVAEFVARHAPCSVQIVRIPAAGAK